MSAGSTGLEAESENAGTGLPPGSRSDFAGID